MPQIPEAKHDFRRGDGTRLQYLELSTAACPSCNPDDRHMDRRLALVMRIDNTAILQCVNCAHDVRMETDRYDREYKAPSTDT